MAQPNIDTTDVVAAVQNARGVMASATTLISTLGTRIQAAVTAALEADDAADQGSVDAAMAAIRGETTALTADAQALAAAISANP